MASTLQQAITTIRQADYTAVVILTAVGYDYILTFATEVQYIWNQPWTRVSALFFLARYFGLCFVMVFALLGSSFLPGPAKASEVLYTLGIWATMIFIGAADLVMILRVWALYGRSKFILGALLSLYAVEVIVALVNCIIVSTRNERLAVTAQVLDSTFCVVQYGSPIWSEITDSAQIALGVSMCLLVAIQFVRQSLQMYKATKRFNVSPYTNLLAREGLIYFLAILAYALIDIMYYITIVPTNGWWMLLTVFPQSVPAVTLVPRFVFTLRELYTRDVQGRHGNDVDTAFGFTWQSSHRTSMASMSFADALQNGGEEISMGENGTRSDTAFGLTSAVNHGADASTIMFADGQEQSQGEEMQMGERGNRSVGSGA